jgi:hypothetical protein
MQITSSFIMHFFHEFTIAKHSYKIDVSLMGYESPVSSFTLVVAKLLT